MSRLVTFSLTVTHVDYDIPYERRITSYRMNRYIAITSDPVDIVTLRSFILLLKMLVYLAQI